MQLLVLGGTQFVGRHIVKAALAHGWQVTLFNRGQTNAELFPDVEKLRGDRDPRIDPGLSALAGRRWDVVIDCNGYVPRLVRASAEALRESCEHYLFISTGSVYDFNQLQGEDDERAPLLSLEDPTTEVWFGPAYGGLKVLCEEAVAEIYGERSVSLRLGIVAGPHDPTDRVTYWVVRGARGGDALAFGSPETPLQFIDARDLAEFTLLAAERRYHGVYNTIGPCIHWSHFLHSIQQATRVRTTYHWRDDESFLERLPQDDRRTFGALPLVMPPRLAHIFTFKDDRALAAGLRYRSTLNTVRDILAWDQARPADEERVAGLSPEEEHALL
ncbi:MAG: NAD-dependent epimerase/dehydratase family protein [Chloroflexi bacterium]|nr:NAD-dependent epimerase/dehydratase family protein [Chloroflexota bacterium]